MLLATGDHDKITRDYIRIQCVRGLCGFRRLGFGDWRLQAEDVGLGLGRTPGPRA